MPQVRVFLKQPLSPAGREFFSANFPLAFDTAVRLAQQADLRRADMVLEIAEGLRPGEPAATRMRKWLDGAGEPVLYDTFHNEDIRQDWESQQPNWRREKLGYANYSLVCDTDLADCTILSRKFKDKDFLLGVDAWSWSDRPTPWLGIVFRRQPGRFLYFLISDEHDAVRVGAAREWKNGPVGEVPDVTVTYASDKKRHGGRYQNVFSKTPYRLSIFCQGNRFHCFVEGDLVASGVDQNPTGDRVGFLVTGGGARFRYLNIYRPVPFIDTTSFYTGTAPPQE